MDASPKKIARRQHLIAKGGADKAPGEKRKPWCTKRHTPGRPWPIRDVDKTPEQKAREKRRADNQTRGVLLVHALYRRAA